MTAPRLEEGVHNERTALSWSRTGLSVLAGGAVVGRLALERGDGLVVAGLVVTLPVALSVVWFSRQYAVNARIGDPRPLVDCRAPTLLAVLVLLLGAIALVLVVLRA